MMKMDEIDANFRIARPEDEKYTYTSFRELTLEGFPWWEQDKELLRLPRRLMDSVRPPLAEIAYTCAGGVVRFRTDSARVSLRCRYRKMRYSSGMPLAADAGIDLYQRDADGLQFLANYRPEPGENEIRMEAQAFPQGESEYALYLPLYSGLEELWIGVEKTARLKPAEQRTGAVLFYGSSVTNGGCASRPGLTYPAMVTRALDCPMINLGYNGNARGDQCVAQEIAQLKLSLLVMEYDHNAPSPAELRATHEPFYRIIRDAQPQLPVVFLSRPWFARAQKETTEKMREVVLETFAKARRAEEPVAFVDGMSLFEQNKTDCTVDGIHPDDLGFRLMADAILQTVRSNFPAVLEK